MDSARSANKDQTQFRVAIVEDERLVAENLKEILEENHFQVVVMAASGTEAISKIQTTNPDLVLMDIRLKGDIDGIETAILLQSSWRRDFPIIFLTAHSQQQFPHLSKVNTSYLYLTKPYSQQELLNAVQKMLPAN